MLAKEIKPGTLVVYNDSPCLVRSVSVHSPSARGAATLYKFRAINLKTKSKVDLTLKGTDQMEVADFEKRPVQLMYVDGDQVHFMDQTDFNQYTLPEADVSDELQYISDATEGVLALIYNDACIGIQIPQSVELTITECDPGVRGNSATSRTKSAKLETGATIQVPEYINSGEKIRVDTEEGKYLGRV
jgi:elongation factor P